MGRLVNIDAARAALLPWRACEPYPSCEGVPMDWHVRTDDDLDYIVCETHDEGLANLIAADHNQQQRLHHG